MQSTLSSEIEGAKIALWFIYLGTELHKNFIFLIQPLCGKFYKRMAEDIIHFCTTEWKDMLKILVALKIHLLIYCDQL